MVDARRKGGAAGNDIDFDLMFLSKGALELVDERPGRCSESPPVLKPDIKDNLVDGHRF